MMAQAIVTIADITTLRRMIWRLAYFKELGIGRERELADDQPRIIVERVEALEQKGEQRTDIDDADPQERRQQKQEGEQLRPREEDVGDPVEEPVSLFG